MASDPRVGEQLAVMLSVIRRVDQNTISTNQNRDMSLLWPLLPVILPQPPPLLTELLRETDAVAQDKCDVCGKSDKTFMILEISSKGAELMHRSVLEQKRSSIDRMVDAIEHMMDETLNNIEQTTLRTTELNNQTTELYESGKSLMTDAELLNRLKTLMKQKETQEKRVKALETQERQMQESLITAIKWIKEIKPKDQQSSSGINLNRNQNKKGTSSQQQNLQEDIFNERMISLVQDELNEITENHHNSQKENENNVYHRTEITPEIQISETKEMSEKLIKKESVSKVITNKQSLTQNKLNDENYNEITLHQSLEES